MGFRVGVLSLSCNGAICLGTECTWGCFQSGDYQLSLIAVNQSPEAFYPCLVSPSCRFITITTTSATATTTATLIILILILLLLLLIIIIIIIVITVITIIIVIIRINAKPETSNQAAHAKPPCATCGRGRPSDIWHIANGRSFRDLRAVVFV